MVDGIIRIHYSLLKIQFFILKSTIIPLERKGGGKEGEEVGLGAVVN